MSDSQLEIFLIQMVGPVSVILRNIALPWIFVGCRFKSKSGFWLKFIMDFSFLVMPVIFSMTLFSEHISVILIFQIIALFSLSIFYLCEYCFIAREKPSLKHIANQIIDDQHISTKFVIYMRSMILIATAVAILAIDFPIFPQRFAKTSVYGRSLMDVGAASFVFCLGCFDVFKHFSCSASAYPPKRGFKILFSSSAILLYLGILRTVILKLIGYQQDVTEYGVHWNFFFTLAFIKIITKALCRRFHFLLGLIFISIHQLILGYAEFQDWLLSEDVPRNDFFSANREGIFSLIGYLSLYYFSSVIARFIASTGIRLKSWFQRNLQLLLLASFLFFLQKCSQSLFGPPSRRIANITYVMEMLVFHSSCMAAFLFVQFVSLFCWAAKVPQFTSDENPFENQNPCLLNSINEFAMSFFLLSNLLTGFVNLTIVCSEYTNAYHSTTVIIIYMFVSCALITGAYFVTQSKRKNDPI